MYISIYIFIYIQYTVQYIVLCVYLHIKGCRAVSCDFSTDTAKEWQTLSSVPGCIALLFATAKQREINAYVSNCT